MLGMTPAKAVNFGTIELKVKPYPEQKVLPEDDNRRRATDMIWSWDTFRLDMIVQNPGQRVLYYLAPTADDVDGPQRAFVREELMLVSEDTEVPLEW